MSKKLVLYFSVYGTAKKVAEEIARQTGADLTEIIPETPYDSNRDNYNALAAYAKKEHDEDMRPAIKNDINIADYDTIFVGFPIWWYVAPTIINTFLEAYDFSGKTIILFATSGGSGMGNSAKELRPSVSDSAVINDGKRFSANASVSELKEWVNSFGI